MFWSKSHREQIEVFSCLEESLLIYGQKVAEFRATRREVQRRYMGVVREEEAIDMVRRKQMIPCGNLRKRNQKKKTIMIFLIYLFPCCFCSCIHQEKVRKYLHHIVQFTSIQSSFESKWTFGELGLCCKCLKSQSFSNML